MSVSHLELPVVKEWAILFVEHCNKLLHDDVVSVIRSTVLQNPKEFDKPSLFLVNDYDFSVKEIK